MAHPDYPEHAKLANVQPKSQAIGQFMEWLQGEKNLVLATWMQDDMDNDYLGADFVDVQKLLAEFFEIDLVKIEQEKRAMLDSQRELNAAPDAARGAS